MNLLMVLNRLLAPVTAFVLIFTLGACIDDDTVPALKGNNTVYALEEVKDSGIRGTITFEELSNGNAMIVIDLKGTSAGKPYPAHLHFNTAAEGGEIALILDPVEGDAGGSTTMVTTLEDGSVINYNDLLMFDGYVHVHKSESDMGTIVAQGDIGQNALTGENVVYEMSGAATGMATFYERLNGETLVILNLKEYPFSGNHPSHIHAGSLDLPRGIVITLNKVNADGVSRTNISTFDEEAGGEMVSYTDLLYYEGYINVHQSQAKLDVIISHGDFGSNI